MRDGILSSNRSFPLRRPTTHIKRDECSLGSQACCSKSKTISSLTPAPFSCNCTKPNMPWKSIKQMFGSSSGSSDRDATAARIVIVKPQPEGPPPAVRPDREPLEPRNPSNPHRSPFNPGNPWAPSRPPYTTTPRSPAGQPRRVPAGDPGADPLVVPRSVRPRIVQGPTDDDYYGYVQSELDSCSIMPS